MCGIVAVVSTNGRPVDPGVVASMRDALAHRGPDASGLHDGGQVVLGHRRLAILDLNPRATQPMSSDDGSIWVVFNGEIYNYVELREELRGRGYQFRSDSDTEVLLKLYEDRGDAFVDELRGMFAFVLWDGRKRRLFAARDRLGKKPLYYARTPEALLFASEIKAILKHPSFVARPRWASLHSYLALQYVPSPATAFEEIERLPPGHTLSWSGGDLSVRRYWRLSYQPKSHLREADALEELTSIANDAVRLRLRSDVPLGIHLSGGLDSSVVTALAARIVPDVHTFSIGFDDPQVDERAHARAVAQAVGARHHEFVMRPDLVHQLPQLAYHYDQPFADPAALATYVLSEQTRQHVTVALNGDGGDEAFGGYARYGGNAYLRWLRRLPGPVKTSRAWSLSAGALSLVSPRAAERLRRAHQFANETPQKEYCRLMSQFGPEWLDDLYAPSLRDRLRGVDAYERMNAAFAEAEAQRLGPLDTLLAVDTHTYLPDCLLVKVDVASMAFGLEVRSPLLDHRLFEFAARLPEEMKVRGGTVKYLLRRLAETLVPREILERPKAGFVLPLGRWFREELGPFLRTTLLDGSALERGYFQRESVTRLIARHQSGERDYSRMLWNLLMFELWHRRFIDGAAS